MGPQAELRLLDGFELSIDGTAVRVSMPSQRLLALLAMTGRTITRVRAATTLWPDRQESRAVANLRSALWRIPPAARRVVEVEHDQLKLATEVTCDAADAERAARLVISETNSLSGTAEAGEVVRLLRRRLLPGWYDEWIVAEQERAEQLRLHALEAICRQLSAAGNHVVAVEAGAAAVEIGALAESAHQALAEAYLAAGNAGLARLVFDRFRSHLDDELSAEPTESFRRLVHVKEQRAGDA
jgi:DNA-binding SARP family transcriptional activator